jgi:hypothetical protein
MAILSYKDERADWIVSEFLKRETLACNPVVAGGFALFVHRVIQEYNTDEKWSKFVRGKEGIDPVSLQTEMMGQVSDIDIWFLADNKYSAMFANDVSQSAGDKRTFTPKEFGAMIGFDKFNGSTIWSNSHSYSKSTLGFRFDHQIIKKSFASIEDLLGEFDFINCSVAWNNGIMYYNDKLDDSFRASKLRYNKKPVIANDDHMGRVFHAARSFKYSKRFDLEFDSDVAKTIFETYLDTKEFCQKVLDAPDISCSIVAPRYASPYGQGEVFADESNSRGKYSASVLVGQFYNSYKYFSKMNVFKSEWNLYMLDVPYLKSIVRGFVEKNKLINNDDASGSAVASGLFIPNLNGNIPF